MGPMLTGQEAVYVNFLAHIVPADKRTLIVGEQCGQMWCQMWSDDLELLHGMAARIEVSRQWFCGAGIWKHYDIWEPKRDLAIHHGAIEIGYAEYLREKYRKLKRGGLRQD